MCSLPGVLGMCALRPGRHSRCPSTELGESGILWWHWLECRDVQYLLEHRMRSLLISQINLLPPNLLVNYFLILDEN